ncbi:MAG: hypothetical protein ACRDHE_17020, partial [Ktedonobacterales bacterium]
MLWRLHLSSEQVEEVLQALHPEAAMQNARGGPGWGRTPPTSEIFRGLSTARGWRQFVWHPHLCGRIQELMLRPDLSLEVWEELGRIEDFATTCALEPVRERLSALARR